MNSALTTPPPKAEERWKFLRDVLVFQLKMAIDNLRDFALMPVSLGAAVLDLIYRGERQGALFYKVLEWGARSERVIDVYSAIGQPPAERPFDPPFTIDGVVERLGRVVVREVEKGGSAATVKAAMDRVLDQVHEETASARDKASGLITRASQKLRP